MTGKRRQDKVSEARGGVSRFLPCVAWLRSYDPGALRGDLGAAAVITALLVPQAVAYAYLAGLPPRVGFVSAAAAPLAYALLGTSRHLSVGPVALVSILTGQAVAAATDGSGVAPETAALALALLIGALLLAIGLLRLGFLINFVSDPVLTGFVSAAALLIGASQLGALLGVDVERASTLAGMLGGAAAGLAMVDWTVVAISAASLAAVFALPPLCRRLSRALDIPAAIGTALSNGVPFLLLAGALIAVYALGLEVPAVGEVSIDFERPGGEVFSVSLLADLLPDALAISLLAYVLAMGAATTLAGRRRQRIGRNNEASALGAANLAAGLVGGYPVGASMSRSALAAELGARTPLAALVAGLLALAVALGSTGLFVYLPQAVLAALIVSAIAGLIDPGRIMRCVRYSKADAAAVLVTLVAVLGLGIRLGIAIGALTSLILYLYRTSRPRIVVEGHLQRGDGMRHEDRRDVDETDGGVLVVRIDDDLYFGNASYCEQWIAAELTERGNGVTDVVLDLKRAGDVDATAMFMLLRLNDSLQSLEIALHIAHASKPVTVKLRHAGLMKALEQDSPFATASEAADELSAEASRGRIEGDDGASGSVNGDDSGREGH